MEKSDEGGREVEGEVEGEPVVGCGVTFHATTKG